MIGKHAWEMLTNKKVMNPSNVQNSINFVLGVGLISYELFGASKENKYCNSPKKDQYNYCTNKISSKYFQVKPK